MKPALLLLLALPTAFSQQAQRADLLLTHGNVITLNDQQPRAQAIAIQGGRIVWVGSDAEARNRFTAATRTVDLNGATVLPGIADAHTHLLNLGEGFLKLNVKDVPTEQEVVERVRERAKTAKPGEWILGWGWDEGAWAAHYPTYRGLTEAAPNNPVYLTGLHTFAAWGNKKALEIAGITRDTKDPENGKIIRDEKTGEPTGVFTNRAQTLVAKFIPPLDKDHTKHALELGAQECLRYGLTSVHEATVSPNELQALRELVQEGKMPLRVYVMLDGASTALVDEWLKKGPEVDGTRHRLTIRSVKVFADGALGSRGAAMTAPYSDAPQTKGLMVTSEAKLTELTRRCLEKGFQVATHAIGDAANHMVLDAYEKALKETGTADARLRIEHAQVVAPQDIPRFAKLGVIASMQPAHCTSDMAWAGTRVGPERVKGAYAWRSILKTGAHLPLSSDFPGETLSPFAGWYAAVTRQDATGNPPGGWYPEQRLTLDEALRGYTREAAYAEFEEKDKGSIEIGKLADLTVISKDITKVAPKELLTTTALKTYIDGKLVYEESKK